MTCPVVTELARNVSAGFERVYGLRGPLDRQVRRAGRALPAALRREAHLLAEAWEQAHHPRLSRRLDRARLRLAHDRLMAYLCRADAARNRRVKLASLIQTVSVNLLAAMAVLAGIAVWRGLV